MGGRGSSGDRAKNSIISFNSKDYGNPGIYEVYRAGDLSAPNKMIFLSASYGEASNYGKDKGYGAKNIDTYHVEISNPLVVKGDTDGELLRNAWISLHPNQQYPKGAMNDSKWQRLDRQNAEALKTSRYDAIIYLKKSGRHEVQIPKYLSNKLKLIKSDRHSGKFYTYDNRWV